MFQSRFGNRRIWMVGFRKNFSRCRKAIYFNGVQRRIPNSHISFDVSGTRTSRNERTGWSDTENVAYNCTLSYGTCESFGSVYSFHINVYGRSYFSSTTNQIYENKRQQSYHIIQTYNRYETFSITFTHLIWTYVVQKATVHVSTKVINMRHQEQNGFLRYLRWNSTASKRIYFVRTEYKEYNIFIWCYFDEKKIVR